MEGKTGSGIAVKTAIVRGEGWSLTGDNPWPETREVRPHRDGCEKKYREEGTTERKETLPAALAEKKMVSTGGFNHGTKEK